MEITELTCPNCCAPLELNRSTGLAKCEYCESTFLYNKSQKKAKEPAATTEHRPAQRVSYDAPSSSSDNGGKIITRDNLVWWILGFIFLFPVALTVLAWKSSMPKPAKIAVTVVVWLFMLVVAFSD